MDEATIKKPDNAPSSAIRCPLDSIWEPATVKVETSEASTTLRVDGLMLHLSGRIAFEELYDSVVNEQRTLRKKLLSLQ